MVFLQTLVEVIVIRVVFDRLPLGGGLDQVVLLHGGLQTLHVVGCGSSAQRRDRDCALSPFVDCVRRRVLLLPLPEQIRTQRRGELGLEHVAASGTW